jgi:hypothetical protein
VVVPVEPGLVVTGVVVAGTAVVPVAVVPVAVVPVAVVPVAVVPVAVVPVAVVAVVVVDVVGPVVLVVVVGGGPGGQLVVPPWVNAAFRLPYRVPVLNSCSTSPVTRSAWKKQFGRRADSSYGPPVPNVPLAESKRVCGSANVAAGAS